jgi:hypothetical protein
MEEIKGKNKLKKSVKRAEIRKTRKNAKLTTQRKKENR